MIKNLIYLLSLMQFMMASTIASANGSKSFCFQNHVKESILINTNRKIFYSKLTNGKSDRIFNTLIRNEHLTLIPGLYFDMNALSYQNQGIDLFCREFKSMIPVKKVKLTQKMTSQEHFYDFEWEFYKEKFITAIEQRELEEIKKISIDALLELKSQPSFHCFSRHLIESIYRIAHFFPLRVKEAQEKGLKNPSPLIFKLIRLHTLGLKKSNKVDQLSQPIQKKGIPILCSELPNLLSDLSDPELLILKRR